MPPSPCPETPAQNNEILCTSCPTGHSLQVQSFDCRAFRDTLGSFATGVTVVTARAANGEPIGLTVSSFNAVSLDPPLILWSLSRTSPNLDAFLNASHYSVNVLAVDQQAISDRFAGRSGERFAGLVLREGLNDVPLIEGCCSWFECSNETQYVGGDHLIFVGSVIRFAQGETQAPLVFHGGAYRKLEGD
jgi:flavin reductase (DIM6/NTAB) family NADH-FMN oxidoreductase RutF